MGLYNLFETILGYLYKKLCRTRELEPIPLDPRERIVFEDYMLKKDLQELRDIFSYVRKKENDIKEKCTKLP